MLTRHHVQTIQRMTGDELRALVSSGFDANYYLDANPDVRAAACPALDHYLQYGWLEGRFPSAHFAACASMFDIADLQAIGVDPFALFLLVRATSQPLVDGDADAALAADPLASWRMRDHARYAATLVEAGSMGNIDWSRVPVEPTHDSRYRSLAARLRLALNAYVGRPIVVLPDGECPGVLNIARGLDEHHVAFIHFGEMASTVRWRTLLSNVVALSSELVDNDEAMALVIADVLRGVVPSLVVDLGARSLRGLLVRDGALFRRKALQLVAVGTLIDDPPGFECLDWIVKVALDDVVKIDQESAAGTLPVDAPAFAPDQLRDIITKILGHGI